MFGDGEVFEGESEEKEIVVTEMDATMLHSQEKGREKLTVKLGVMYSGKELESGTAKYKRYRLSEKTLYSGIEDTEEFGEKLSPETRGKVERANEALKEAIKSGNTSTMRSSMEELNAAWNEASSQMYQSATADAPQGEAPPPSDQDTGKEQKADGKKVEDAQYEVVDDKDKNNK